MMAPVRRVSQLFGATIFAIAWGLIHTTVVLTVLVLFFGIDLSNANFLSAGVLMLIGSFSIIGIGMMAAALPLLWVERGDQMVFVINSLLLLVSGVYYSVTILPEWMQTIAKFSPATYVLDGIRDAILNGAGLSTMWDEIWPLLLIGAVSAPVGLWVFRRGEVYAKKHGKLKRSG